MHRRLLPSGPFLVIPNDNLRAYASGEGAVTVQIVRAAEASTLDDRRVVSFCSAISEFGLQFVSCFI